MSKAQAESVIKNIIREIAQECATQGQAVSETLVAFIVKAIVLNPENDFNVDRALTRDDVERLIQKCVETLLDNESPSLDTIKMQVYFDMNYTGREEFLTEHKRVLDNRLDIVLREITDSRARTKEELEALYRKMVSFIILKSGLGSPTDINVVREATAALQSIFPQTELGPFLAMVKKDKERQLQELILIVTGIRLFNKDCGKGGEGIDDLPSLLSEAIPETLNNIDQNLGAIRQMAYKYTDSLVNSRQHEGFLQILLDDAHKCNDHSKSVEIELKDRLNGLRTIVQSKTAVPTAQVYPQFIRVAQLWRGLQDELVLLSVLNNILYSLEPFARLHQEIFTDEVLEPYLEYANILSDEERVQYGFCAYTCAIEDRFLLPGDPNIGIIRYKGHNFAFSSQEAAHEFASDPDNYINMATENAKFHPELIQLLELHKQFATISPYGRAADSGKMVEAPVTKADMGTQTDTHILESNIVKSYEWNEWELRRKALKLANLRTKVTHSAQTNLSHFRRDNISQVYLPKENKTQTKKDSYSKVPKPSRYISGLRGCSSEDTVMQTVDLTVTVEEDL
ncbi:uncharacterized protein TRIADDRAFT_50604 [Trichoplax adhaerens]|uniref:Cilia- and flagella-associated protein 206 n=1 Tax=Trichoplax adhaerens TaxID=10228 RepID=B3S356_TRIAD|nr:hypothetical protein TRIADDRAFT_50604 [Trichoplax adhaerens]EDV22731.1 hypothetical protein TRIADDRAFT_50604 [Trichoplax adhaerens]|eukprot:XP_002114597.1 hypothetical protein TRIADDRAFT_50604 [Trichoplax adhaerens]